MSRTLCPLLLILLAAAPVRADDAEQTRRAREETAAGVRDFASGAFQDAEAHFEAALKLVDAPNARKNLALALSRQGDEALEAERGETALALFDRALELHPGRVVYAVRRGRALFLLSRESEALRVAEESTERAPTFAEAWLLLADVEERRGELASALEALDRAIALFPWVRELRARRVDLARRVETEGGFLTHATGHFEVRYGPDADPKTVELALTLLEDAWSRVTADLGITPKAAARVVLYGGGEFREITGAHSWVGALYANGTLQVPIKNLERHLDLAARILSHEFTHHVLREATPHLPVWWHEGIAQWAEASSASTDRRYEAIRRQFPALRDAGALLTLEQLRATAIASVRDTAVVQLFYAQSKSFVLWVVDRFGSRALTAFLLALGSGDDTDAAAREAFGSDVPALFSEWLQSL